jgi:hypothetical protein
MITSPHSNAALGHVITYKHEAGRKSGELVTSGGTRARCSCGWFSDCYAMSSDTDRAVEVHLRRAERADFNALLARSSIGAAVEDVRRRGIDVHLVDLEHQLRQTHRARKARRPRANPVDAAFMRGFGVAIASIWRCHHDGQMVEHLLRENGFTLASFKGVGLLRADYAAICQALKSRGAKES